MEYRKVQQIGGSTFSISLPKSWAESVRLKRGNRVTILQQRDNSLVISPGLKSEERRMAEIRVEPEEPEEVMDRKIIACYLDGYDTLKVKSKGRLSYQHLRRLNNFVRRMSGLEIVEETPDMVVINAMVRIVDFPLDRGIERAHLIASVMYDEASTAIREKNPELAKGVDIRDDDIDRLYFLISRQLRAALTDPAVAKALDVNPADTLDYLVAIDSIEHVADSLEAIAQLIPDLCTASINEGLRERVLRLADEAFKLYDSGAKAFLSKDMNGANRALRERDELKSKLGEIVVEVLGQNQQVVLNISQILLNLRNIAYYGGDVAEAAVNRAERLSLLTS